MERDGRAVREAVRLANGHTAVANPLAEFEAQAALSDAGLAHDADNLSVPAQALREGALEALEFVSAPDEGREAARACDVESRSQAC